MINNRTVRSNPADRKMLEIWNRSEEDRIRILRREIKEKREKKEEWERQQEAERGAEPSKRT